MEESSIQRNKITFLNYELENDAESIQMYSL